MFILVKALGYRDSRSPIIQRRSKHSVFDLMKSIVIYGKQNKGEYWEHTYLYKNFENYIGTDFCTDLEKSIKHKISRRDGKLQSIKYIEDDKIGSLLNLQ